MKLKRGLYIFWLFSKIGLRSAIPMESSRRDLLNDVAEHLSVFKIIIIIIKNTYCIRFSFITKPDKAFPKKDVFVFTVIILINMRRRIIRS